MPHETVHDTINSATLTATKAEMRNEEDKIEIDDQSEKVNIHIPVLVGGAALRNATEVNVVPHPCEGDVCDHGVGYSLLAKTTGKVVFKSHPKSDTKDLE